LLEAMQEHSVTIAGVTHRLDGLFFVLATQNPLEMEGTYPLPEAQLDRFFFKLLVRFPDTDDMVAIMARTTAAHEPGIEPQMGADDILQMRALAREIPVADEVCRYAVRLVMASHPDHPSAPEATRRFVRYGSSPRGAQAMLLAAKIRAILDHRYHVARDDLRATAHDALRHRLILNFEGQAENVRPDDVITDILDSTDGTPHA
jgi:MoxR-like ATPase